MKDKHTAVGCTVHVNLVWLIPPGDCPAVFCYTLMTPAGRLVQQLCFLVFAACAAHIWICCGCFCILFNFLGGGGQICKDILNAAN